jgi:tetratricopeptide (TPR) repeat protein
MYFYKIICDKGIEYIKANIEKLASQARLPYDDRFLNFFGYQFIAENKADIAINLFKMNVELFPKIPNTYDSLAEVYLKSGNTTNALKYYRMEQQLDPNNPRIKKIIADLESGK